MLVWTARAYHPLGMVISAIRLVGPCSVKLVVRRRRLMVEAMIADFRITSRGPDRFGSADRAPRRSGDGEFPGPPVEPGRRSW